MLDKTCYHCGDSCGNQSVHFDDKDFCFHGCKTVYDIFSTNGLSNFYEQEAKAGFSPNTVKHK